MAKLIIRKEKELPAEMRELLGKSFVPTVRKDVWYVPSSINPQGLGKVAFYVFLPVSICATLFFLSIVYSGLTNEFRSEVFYIALVVFLFAAGIQTLTILFDRKFKKLNAAIASGERRFGLWVTPRYLMINDFNGGIECVEKKEIESMAIYESGRPRIDMVVIQLQNKQRIRIVADWLVGYYGNVQRLKENLQKSL